MRHNDAYQLTNASLGRRLASTLAVAVAGALFGLTWLSVSFLAEVSGTRHATAESFGGTLREIAWTAPTAFVAFFAAHFLTLGIALLIGLTLFRRSAVRRKVRAALMVAAVLMSLFDGLIWLTVPFFEFSQGICASVGVVEAALLLVLLGLPLKQMWWFRRWEPRDGKPKRVVVVGGGFAGLDVVLGLDRTLGYHEKLEIVLVDRNNYFLFPPLLPSVAAGAIETRQVTYPFRRIFETTNVIFRKAEVVRIAPERQRIYARVAYDQDRSGRTVQKTSTLDYDVLVLAPGAEVNTFRTPGAEHAFLMRELRDAIRVRNQVIDCFEQAAAAASRVRQRELLTFVICGAGPTGVEVATEIHDLIHHVLLQRYPEIPEEVVSVKVVQSGEQILKGWHDRVVKTATQQMQSLSIDLLLGPRVAEIGPRHVGLNNGESIATRTVIWCAGVRPSPLLARSGLPLDKSGRGIVTPDLRAQGHDNVFVVGDSCHFVDPATERPLPPLGQVAFQQGSRGASNVVALLADKPLKPFRYFNFGSLVSVGEHFAAVNLLGVRLSGFIGWFVWRSLYLTKMVGISNKIRVVLDWTLDLLVERSISQILEREHPDEVEARASEADRLSSTSLAPSVCRSVVEEATSQHERISGEVREDDSGATGILISGGRETLSATIALLADEEDGSLELTLEADLPETCQHHVALSRQEGLLALLRAMNELTVEDEQLDETFIIDADDGLASLILELKEPLMVLGRTSAQIDIEGPLLRISADSLPAEPERVRDALSAALGLWQRATDELHAVQSRPEE